MRRFALLALVALVAPAALPAKAVTIDWVTVGDPGNAPDGTGFGAVAYGYRISKYEVTNAQYVEFLNAKAATDIYGLYNDFMAGTFAGITRSGTPGSFTYSTIAGRENMPVNFVSFFDALRFANWLHNGQGVGDTETGAYTLLGGTATPTNGDRVGRNDGATIFLTSEDEWYKAGYYDAASASFFDYPVGTDIATACAIPGATPNTANCAHVAADDVTVVGSYTGSASPAGTFDQGGNLWEWNETLNDGARGLRGGSFDGSQLSLAAANRGPGSAGSGIDPSGESYNLGFRVASVPEPGAGLLVMTGLLGLAAWRHRRT